MGFLRQEYWSGLPCPPPEDLPDPGIELMSLRSPALAGRLFTTSATWGALHEYNTPHSSTSPTVTGTEVKDSITTCPSTRAQGLGLWLQQTWEVWDVSPTIEPPSRQPTNWRTVIPKKFLLFCKSSGTHNRFPNLKIQQRG